MDVPAPAGRTHRARSSSRAATRFREGSLILLLESVRQQRRRRRPAAGHRGRAALPPAAAEASAPPAARAAPAAARPGRLRAACGRDAGSGREPPRQVDESAFSQGAMPVLRCASSRANWAPISAGSPARGPKGRITSDDVKAYVKRLLTAAGARGGGGAAEGAGGGFREIRRRSRSSRCRASSASPARGCRRAGSICRTSPSTTRPTSPISRPSARAAQGQGAAGGREAHAARVHHQGLRAGAARSSRASMPRWMRAGENLVLKKYFHIGFAADTPEGLVVPVIRDADRKDICSSIARALGELSEKARAGKLTAAEMQGGSFTDLEPGRHRRHRVHARSSMRRKSRSSGCRAPAMKPVFADGASCRG